MVFIIEFLLNNVLHVQPAYIKTPRWITKIHWYIFSTIFFAGNYPYTLLDLNKYIIAVLLNKRSYFLSKELIHSGVKWLPMTETDAHGPSLELASRIALLSASICKPVQCLPATQRDNTVVQGRVGWGPCSSCIRGWGGRNQFWRRGHLSGFPSIT